MLVSFGPNLRYLTGFTGSNGNLLLLSGEAILFTDPRYQIQAAQEVTCRVQICQGAAGAGRDGGDRQAGDCGASATNRRG